jgi:hypothetical protein
MNARWQSLLGVIVVAALALALFARLPHGAPAAPAAPAPRHEWALALAWRDGALHPQTAAVPKDYHVHLTVTNASPDTLDLTLAGYEDRVHVRVAPDSVWRGTFLADRPGEAFAWRAGGRMVGRLAVIGSHLEEGHR